MFGMFGMLPSPPSHPTPLTLHTLVIPHKVLKYNVLYPLPHKVPKNIYRFSTSPSPTTPPTKYKIYHPPQSVQKYNKIHIILVLLLPSYHSPYEV